VDRNKFFIIINSLDKGGAERIASEFSFFLEKQGFSVVFLLTDNNIIRYKLPATSKVIKLPLSKYIKVLFPLVVIVQAIYIRLYFGTNFKAISFLHRANIVNGLSSVFSKRVVVVSERSLFSKSYRGIKYFLMKILLKILFIRVHKIIAISQVVKVELQTYFKVHSSKIEVIHNPINTQEFKFNKEKDRLYDDTQGVNFCTVSRLIELKRVDLVIDLFNRILKIFPKSKLHILGDGDCKQKLIEQVRALNIQKDVIFYGNVDDVYSILKKNNIFLFASSFESFGNVVLEAISSGLPVIYSSNLNSIKEIFSESNNLSLSFNEKINDKDIKAIIKFIETLDFESFKQERKRLLNNFDSNTIFKKYLNQLNT